MTATFWIERVERWVVGTAEPEFLEFVPGINVIVGAPNSGKTGWLKTIDYCFGDRDGPTESLGATLAAKYERAALLLRVGEDSIRLERAWGAGAIRSRVRIGSDSVPDRDFSEHFLEILGVPPVKFPLGNPYNETQWREVSWRMMLRHLYRGEFFWTDFADQQRPQEQAASVLQLLGLAEASFPESALQLIALRRQAQNVAGKIDQLEETFRTLASALMTQPTGLQGAVGTVQQADESLGAEIQRLSERRAEVLAATRDSAGHDMDGYEEAVVYWRNANADVRAIEARITETQERTNELVRYRDSISAELLRAQRSRGALATFGSMRVTHCPVCDRGVEMSRADDACYLCLRPLDSAAEISPQAADTRINFEVSQLRAESEELAELVATLTVEHQELISRLGRARVLLAQADAQLRPYREAATSPEVDVEVSSIDREIGFIEGRREAMRQLATLWSRREELEAEHAALLTKVEAASQGESHAATLREEMSAVISEQMNSYLRLLTAIDPDRWLGPDFIGIELTDREIRGKAGGGSWKRELGGTLQYYFLLAYHFALLSRSGGEASHHPGLTILDFQPDLQSVTAIGTNLGVVLQPFETLMGFGNHPRQLIAAGHSFEALTSAHEIRLEEVWVSPSEATEASSDVPYSPADGEVPKPSQ